MSGQVTIYTTRFCGYCMAAKHLLEKRDVAFREVRVDDRPDLRPWLFEVSSQRTVPQIFINGESIGGYSELSALDKSAGLDELLARAPSPDDPQLRD